MGLIKGIHFYKGGTSINENTLWQRPQDNFKDDLTYKKKDLFIAALKRSCEDELKATIQGCEPPSSQYVRIGLITDASQCDSPEEFAALKNQYGGFLQDYAPSRQPSLRNARIVCLFAGARLASDEEDKQYLDQFGARFGLQALKDYAANAFLCPVILDLTDRHGKPRKESMLMVIQDRPIAPGKQIKLDYAWGDAGSDR